MAPEKGWPHTPGQWWDGGLARYVRIPEHYCYEINEDVPMRHVAVFEPLGVVVNAISKIKPRVGEIALVIGGGPVGLFATALFKSAGVAKIIASEVKPKRRELLKKCGADIIVDPLNEDLLQIVMDNSKGFGAHVIVEGVGTQLPAALDAVAFGGRIAQIGIPSSNLDFKPFQIYVKEVQIYGSFLMKFAMNDTIRILENRLVPMDTIITHVLPLEKVNEGIEIARQGEGGKVVITPNEI